MTLVDEEVANKIGLTGRRKLMKLQWFGDNESTKMSRQVSLRIQGTCQGASPNDLEDVQTVRNFNLPELCAGLI